MENKMCTCSLLLLLLLWVCCALTTNSFGFGVDKDFCWQRKKVRACVFTCLEQSVWWWFFKFLNWFYFVGKLLFGGGWWWGRREGLFWLGFCFCGWQLHYYIAGHKNSFVGELFCLLGGKKERKKEVWASFASQAR